jgi:hypothetical protein
LEPTKSSDADDEPSRGRTCPNGKDSRMIDLIVETDLGHDLDECGDLILADIDRDTLWECFRNWA